MVKVCLREERLNGKTREQRGVMASTGTEFYEQGKGA
jgi:hypothetical protein